MGLALAACKNRKQIIEITGLSMGTTYAIAIVDHNGDFDSAEIKSKVDSALVAFNNKLSNWEAGSEISRFNASGADTPTAMSPELEQIMQASADVNAASAGRFDTSIGPLIELWGFGAPGTTAMPNPDQIAAALDVSGQAKTLTLDGGTIAKRHADAQVYLAGLGKGYGADQVGQVLAQMGITDYLIEIGGDLYASGHNPDGLPWQIGVETPNPADRSVIGVVGLSNNGLATSGDYRNYFEVDGQRYSHLIDPTTGVPVTHRTASATVIDDDAMRADAWSTAMLILGQEQGLEIAKAFDVAVQFIDIDKVNGQPAYAMTASQKFLELTA